MTIPDMTPIEVAIYGAAYVDALRNIFEGVTMPERVRQAEKEAQYVVETRRMYLR